MIMMIPTIMITMIIIRVAIKIMETTNDSDGNGNNNTDNNNPAHTHLSKKLDCQEVSQGPGLSLGSGTRAEGQCGASCSS